MHCNNNLPCALWNEAECKCQSAKWLVLLGSKSPGYCPKNAFCPVAAALAAIAAIAVVALWWLVGLSCPKRRKNEEKGESICV